MPVHLDSFIPIRMTELRRPLAWICDPFRLPTPLVFKSLPHQQLNL